MDLNILSDIQCFARVSPKKGNPIVPFLLLSPPPTLSGILCNIVETVLIIAEELPGRAAIYIDLNTLSTRVNPKKKIHVFLIFFCRRQPPFQFRLSQLSPKITTDCNHYLDLNILSAKEWAERKEILIFHYFFFYPPLTLSGTHSLFLAH